MTDTRYGFHIASKTSLTNAADYAFMLAAGTPYPPGTIVIDPDTTHVIGIVNSVGILEWFTVGVELPASAKTSGTIDLTDAGHMVAMTAGVTVPANVFARGNCVSFFNTTAGNLTLTQGSGLTMNLAGAASTGDRTFAQKTIATIWFNSTTQCGIIGQGVT